MTETPQSRLRQASKQMHLAADGLEDPSLADDLHEAIALVEDARSELGDSDDRSVRAIEVDRPY